MTAITSGGRSSSEGHAENRRRRLGREDAILDAAAEILAERGWSALTVSAVMQRAGISRTAFYREFADIHAVVVRVLRRLGAELAEASGDWFRGELGSPAVIHGNLLSYARAFERHGPALEAVSVAAAVDPRVRDHWDALVTAFSDRTEAAIRRDQSAGVIDPDLDARGAALALTWMGEQASLRLMGHRRSGTPEDYADLLTPIWTRTLFGPQPC